MDRGQKLAAGLLLISAGVIWLLFVIIWLPPVTIVAILIGLKMGLPNTYYGIWLLWVDVAIALTAMAYGGYLLFRCRAAISR
jgi:hypothetical protein